jgi:integrase
MAERDRLSMNQCGATQQQSMEARMEHFTKAPVINTQMRDFGAQTVDLWLSWILTQPTAKNPGRKHFKIELKYLGIVLSWYRNYLDPNFNVPIVKRHRDKAVYKPIKPRRKDHYIRVEDCPGWIDWLKEHRKHPMYWRLGMFQLLTGTRIGEAAGFFWGDVDLEKGVCHVTQSLSWDHWTREPYLVDEVKTEESDRMIHLPMAVVEMLRELKAEGTGEGPVFRNPVGGLVRYNAVKNAYDAAFKALGLRWRATHILRHSWGTHAYKATGNLGMVQAHMGHADQKETQRYAKVEALNDRSAVEGAAALMGFGIAAAKDGEGAG